MSKSGAVRRLLDWVVDQVFSYLWGLVAAFVLSILTIVLAWFKDVPSPFFVPIGGLAFLVLLVGFVSVVKTRDWMASRKGASAAEQPRPGARGGEGFVANLYREICNLAPMAAFMSVMLAFYFVLIVGLALIAWAVSLVVDK